MFRPCAYLCVCLAFFSCKHVATSSSADLKVYGGSRTDDYPFTAFLLNADFGMYCTGSFIDPNTIVTAGHCFPNKSEIAHFGLIKHTTENGIIKVAEGDAFIAADSVVVAETVPDAETLPLTDDLAVVTFKNYSSKERVDFSTRLPQVGDAVDFVGYGRPSTTAQEGSEKKVGHNKIAELGPRIYISAVSAQDLNVSSVGDSGGPLLYDGKLLGVVSAGSKTQKGSLFTNLRTRRACLFLKKTLDDLKIPFKETCEALP